jgi:hypothetical protein
VTHGSRIHRRAFEQALSWLVKQDSRRWVVLFDEADGLVGKTMVSFLTQLRKSYIFRDSLPFHRVLFSSGSVKFAIMHYAKKIVGCFRGSVRHRHSTLLPRR